MAPLRLGRTDPSTIQTTARDGLPAAFNCTAEAAAGRRSPVPPGLVLRAPDLTDLRPGDLGRANRDSRDRDPRDRDPDEPHSRTSADGTSKPGAHGTDAFSLPPVGSPAAWFGGYDPWTLVDLRSPALRDRPAPALTLAAARSALPDRWTGDALLLTRAVPAVHGGTARLRPEGPCDEVAAFEVTAAGRVSGEAARTLLVPRLGRLQRAHRGGDAWRTPLPPWGMRLTRLLRAVRPLADGGTVEWADDGHRCWLLLVHPAD